MAEQKEGGGGQRMIYLALFWSFFQIGLFSIGGGYAALPLIQNQVVNMHGWLSMQEFADIITLHLLGRASRGRGELLPPH